MKTEQQSEFHITQAETYQTNGGPNKQKEGRLQWSRSADFAWGGGASILTALLLWLIFGVSPASVTAPVVTTPTAGAVVAANEPIVVAGNAAPNQHITIVGNDQRLGDVTAGTDGSFSYEISPLEPGEYNVVARTVDDAGQEVTVSEPVTFTVTESRTAAPVAVLPEDQMPVVDLPEGGLMFDENDPRTVSGSGVPGSTITILNGATTLIETLVDAAGKWTLQLPALGPGTYNLTLKQRLPDDSEVTLPEPLTATFAGLKAPQVVMPVEGLRFDPGRPITLEGTGVPGATITMNDEAGKPLGQAIVDALGAWTLTLPALPAGTYAWNTKQTTAEGQESVMAEPLAVTVGEAPAAGTATATSTEAATALPAGAATAIPADAQPVVISPLPEASHPAGQPITLEGAGAPGATITVSDEAGKPLGRAIVDALGAWKLTLPAAGTGSHAWNVTQITTEGVETAAAAPVALTIGEPGTTAEAPAEPAITSPAVGEVQPADEPLTLEGTGEPGATVAVTDAAGKTLGQALVDAAGKWSLKLPALDIGSHALGVTQTTAEGATTTLADGIALAVDAAGTALTSVGQAIKGLAITSPAVGEVQPADEPVTLEGTGEPAATVTITDAAGKPLGQALVDAAGKWSLKLPALDIGSHALGVTQTTAEGATTTLADGIALAVDAAGTALTSVGQAVKGLAITSPAVGEVQSAGQPITLEGTGAPGATVTVSDEAGKPLGKAIVDKLGAWTLTLPAPGIGAHVWNAIQTTAEGIETELLTPLALNVALPDVVLPEVTKPGTDLNVVSGTTVPLEGIGQPGGTIAIAEGANVLAEARVSPTGTWQAEITGLTPGTHGLTLTQTTENGAQVEVAQPLEVTVVGAPSTAGPAAPRPSPSTPSVAAQPAQIVRGGAPTGASVEVYAGDALLGRATANARGVWQLTLPPGLSFNADELTIKAKDASGAPLGEGEASIMLDSPLTLPVTGGRWCWP